MTAGDVGGIGTNSFHLDFDLLASAIVGGIFGSRFDYGYNGDYAIGGILAGMFAFACIRLWLGARRAAK